MPFQILPDVPGFPDPSFAAKDGFLAIGGDLSVPRLVDAYSRGIFPWYNDGDPILWWSPNPRYLINTASIRISKSMRAIIKNKTFMVTTDQAFESVIQACQSDDRPGQSGGTWITEEMRDAYIQLHEAGHAHSLEVWQDGNLVGGLYGVASNQMFSGESMFARVSNASKYALITLAQALHAKGFNYIDCQTHTQHLESMGAYPIERDEFLKLLGETSANPLPVGNWQDFLDIKG